jgi:hypothetical protein
VDKSTECDPSILLPEGKLGCLLSYENMIGEKYMLISGSMIVARVSATNSMGSFTSNQGGEALLP